MFSNFGTILVCSLAIVVPSVLCNGRLYALSYLKKSFYLFYLNKWRRDFDNHFLYFCEKIVKKGCGSKRVGSKAVRNEQDMGACDKNFTKTAK